MRKKQSNPFSKTPLGKMWIAAKNNKRSLLKLIEDWSEIGEIVAVNPETSYQILKNALQGYEETEAGRATPYSYHKKRR